MYSHSPNLPILPQSILFLQNFQKYMKTNQTNLLILQYFLELLQQFDCSTMQEQQSSSIYSQETQSNLDEIQFTSFGQEKQKQLLHIVKETQRHIYQKSKVLIKNFFPHVYTNKQSAKILNTDNPILQNFSIGILQGKNQATYGTCFVIMNNIAVTSAHQAKNQILSIKFPTKDNLTKKVYQKKFFSNENKNTYQQVNQLNDYAFLKFQTNEDNEGDINFKTGSLPSILMNLNKKLPYLLQLRIYGFAKTCPLKNHNQYSVIESHGTANITTNLKLQYTFSTFNGMSGSPLILLEDKKCYLIGMHLGGTELQLKNYGMAFNQQFIQNLQSFAGQKVQTIYKQNIQSTKTLTEVFSQIILQKDKQKKKQHTIFLGQIMYSLLIHFYKFDVLTLFIGQLTSDNIFIFGKSTSKVDIIFDSLKFQGPSSKQLKINHAKIFIDICKQIIKIQSLLQSFQKEYEKTQILNNKFYWFKKIIQRVTNIQQHSLTIIHSQILYLAIGKNNDVIQGKFQSGRFYYIFTTMQAEIGITYQHYKLLSIQKQRIDQQRLRHKFTLYCKYSKEKFQRSFIIKQYMGILDSYYKKIIKINQIFINIRDYLKNIPKPFIDLNKLVKNAQAQRKQLLDLQVFQQKFNFQFKQLYDQLRLQQIQNNYQSLFEQYQIQNTSLNRIIQKDLIFYQILFFKFAQDKFLDDVMINDSFPGLTQETYKQLKQFFIFNQKTQILSQKQIIKIKQLRLNLQKQICQPEKNMQLLENLQSSLLRQVFNTKEHSKHTYSLTELNQNQFQEIRPFIVRIGYYETFLGSGIMISRQYVLTAKHIFKNYPQNQCQVHINGEKKNKYNIISFQPKKLINGNDLIILTIENPHSYTNSIKLIDFDQPKINENIKEFAVLVGYGMTGGCLSLKKSFGQLQINKSSIHPLVGESHLSGSPLLIKKSDQYFIIGVYSGVQISSYTTGKYSKFVGEKFSQEVKKSISTIKYTAFMESSYLIQNSFISFITQNYKTLDHFLLRIIGYILKINNCNVFFKKLHINNLILNREDNKNILFQNVQLASSRNKSQNQKINWEAFKQFLFSLQKYQLIFKQSVIIKNIIIHQNLNKQKSLKAFFFEQIEDNYIFCHQSYSLMKKKCNKIIKKATSSQNPFIQYLKHPKYFIQNCGLLQNLLSLTFQRLSIIVNNYLYQIERKRGQKYKQYEKLLNNYNKNFGHLKSFPFKFLKKLTTQILANIEKQLQDIISIRLQSSHSAFKYYSKQLTKQARKQCQKSIFLQEFDRIALIKQVGNKASLYNDWKKLDLLFELITMYEVIVENVRIYQG